MLLNQVYGSRFRKPRQKRPFWAKVLMGLLVAGCFLYMAAIMYRSSGRLCTAFLSLPTELRLYTGRAVALLLGLGWWISAVYQWRRFLYLEGPLRDLVTTPATSRQLLRIALKPNLKGVESIFMAVAIITLAPWFRESWLDMISLSGRNNLDIFTYPVSVVMALGFGALFKVMMDVLALAWVLASAAAGTGGVSPRHPQLASMTGTTVCVALALVSLMLISTAVYWTMPVPPLFTLWRAFWTVGQTSYEAMRAPWNLLHLLMIWFPTNLWFDALTHAFSGDVNIFLRGFFGAVSWTAAGAAVMWCVMDRALSLPERAAWHGDAGAPKPADAETKVFKRRAYDPDEISGPIEAWFLARYSRISRAILRLMVTNAYVGNIDRMLWRSLKAVVVCVVGGWLTILLVPPLLRFLVNLLGFPMTGGWNEAHVLLAAVWVVAVAFFRMMVWSGQVAGAGVGLHTSFQPTDARLNPRIDWMERRRHGITNARGDVRLPLQEIYAVGFNDALLFPTFYAILATVVIVVLALVEGLVLGLPPQPLIWSAVIAVPAIGQIYYMAGLGSIVQYWADYRREFWPALARSAMVVSLFVTLVIGVGALITYLCYQAVKVWEAPWVAWLGSMNILLVFNVALFMAARVAYVRRRWDAERPPQVRT